MAKDSAGNILCIKICCWTLQWQPAAWSCTSVSGVAAHSSPLLRPILRASCRPTKQPALSITQTLYRTPTLCPLTVIYWVLKFRMLCGTVVIKSLIRSLLFWVREWRTQIIILFFLQTPVIKLTRQKIKLSSLYFSWVQDYNSVSVAESQRQRLLLRRSELWKWCAYLPWYWRSLQQYQVSYITHSRVQTDPKKMYFR